MWNIARKQFLLDMSRFTAVVDISTRPVQGQAFWHEFLHLAEEMETADIF